ncbi:MAG: DedA family protein [Casimicrobiaceae bacterium]
MDFVRLVADHGYTATFIGSLIEGETVLTVAGLAAHRGYLHFALLLALASVGSFIGDQAYFMIGRIWGKRLLARFPRFRPAVRRVDALLVRYAGAAVVAVRFLYGLRSIGPIAMGASRLKWHTFMIYNAIGAVLWSVAWLGAGYFVGEVLQQLLGKLKHVEAWLFAGVATVVLTMAIGFHWRRRKIDRVSSRPGS